jgi:hypothetical protein
MLTPDFIKGLDFTALSPASAGDHNTLIDGATPSTDRGLTLWSVDTALNTPDVPNPLSLPGITTKWKRYVWLRIPHASSSSTVPVLYGWNDSATSVATYLKWQQFESDNSSILALITALDVRVTAVEAGVTSALATANAANSIASTASTNATGALSTANAANTNATQALTNAAAAQTTADAAQATANTALTNAAGAITAANNANAAVAAAGPVFIAPVTIYNAAGALAFTTYDLSASVPSSAKAVILEAYQALPEGVTLYAINTRRDASSSSYTVMRGGSGSGVAGNAGSNQGIYPVTAARTLQLEVTAAIGNPVTVRLIGYIL